MLKIFTAREKELLSMPVRFLRLPALVAPSIVDLYERSWLIGYRDGLPPYDETEADLERILVDLNS